MNEDAEKLTTDQDCEISIDLQILDEASCKLCQVYSSLPQIVAYWPRDGACHANHACAALTVS